LGIPHPEIRLRRPAAPSGWLRRATGAWGGMHIQQAVREADGAGYYQRCVAGGPVAVALLGDGRRARAIDLSRQWTDPAPGAPFRYGGAVAPAALPAAVTRRLVDAAETAAAAGGLMGLGSAGFLVDADGAFWLLEINPRPGATLDILDRADPPPGRSVFTLHLAACAGRLPGPMRPSGAPAMAAAVVYAERAARVPAAMRWPAGVADRTPALTPLGPGAPVCTVIARGESPARAHALAARKALAVKARLDYA